MKKFVSLVLALVLCLGLTVPAMADERPVREMTYEEAVRYVDFAPSTPVDSPDDVHVQEELHIDMGPLGSFTESTGYYAIRKDVEFKLGNLGTPGDGSFLAIYFAPFEKGEDGVYHMLGQYYLRGGSQSGWAQNVPGRPDEAQVKPGVFAGFSIPTESLPEDTLYQFMIMAYLPNEIICKNIYFKVDEAKVAEAMSSSTPAPAAPAASSVDSFSDVAAGSPFRDAIDWAVKQGITTGKTSTTFAPGDTCTVAHILTFIWRSQGSPSPSGSAGFSNLNDSAYYAKAALWAKEKGLVAGNRFDANALCTRGMVAEYLWKLAGSPQTPVNNTFTDVAADDDYAQAVAWAVKNGITNGASATAFAPDMTCTRGQIATFLYRDIGKHPLQAQPAPAAPAAPEAGSKEEQLCARVIELVNQERAKEGLAPLSTIPSLTAAARIRAPELAIEPSHYRPDGSLAFTAMDEAGVPHASASGENLAFGFTDPEDAMKCWMDSPIHRANILMPQYTHIGVAYDDGNWVQLFAGF